MRKKLKKNSPKVLDDKADYGALKLIEGTWVNHNPC